METARAKRNLLSLQKAYSAEALLVRAALIEKGLETPMIENDLSRDQKVEKIQAAMADVVETLGLDLTDDSLIETPHRIAKMYVDEIFSGLDYSSFPKITVIENKMNVEEMVKVKDIDLTSTCEHHFVTIDGSASVAYIPNDNIIGLSKINRLVRFFAQRPQVQERLTQQVLVALQALLNTDNVAVRIDAAHYCVKARGVMDSNSSTQTTALGGLFKSDDRVRGDFLVK
jgi:GTP cyclohydrolase I|tara:strand:- start:940 stop:1626 length:687 start_codon:yes stop_codon:yes gene_type:complete